MPGTGVYVNPCKELLTVSVDQRELTGEVLSNKIVNIFWVKASVISIFLPPFPHKVIIIFFLNVNLCIGKKSDSIRMVPMWMSKNNVRDFIGVETEILQ